MSEDRTLEELEPEDVEFLKQQGWRTVGDGLWLPPSSWKAFGSRKAIQIARHPSYKKLLSYLEYH